jgi:zinc finger protein 830
VFRGVEDFALPATATTLYSTHCLHSTIHYLYTMTDVRALLKQKRQETQISHPLASYTSSGILRCIACGTTIPLNRGGASAWEGHIGSKAHRTAVARLREEEARREEEERVRRKRKVVEPELQVQQDQEDTPMDEDRDEDKAPSKKKRLTPAPPPAAASASNTTATTSNTGNGFPSDFFSDPSRAIAISADSDSDDDNNGLSTSAQPSTSTSTSIPASPGAGIDAEYAAFAAFLEAPAPADTESDQKETYERATLFAEAQLVTAPEGIPNSALGSHMAMESEVDAEPELTDEQKRKLKEQDEAELVMDRLLEEERLQEEADAKVTSLKARLEAMKRKREAAKRAKAG